MDGRPDSSGGGARLRTRAKRVGAASLLGQTLATWSKRAWLFLWLGVLLLAPSVALERLDGLRTLSLGGVLVYGLVLWFVSTLATALLAALSAETAYLIQSSRPVPLGRTLRRGLACLGAAMRVALVLAATSLLFIVCVVLLDRGLGQARSLVFVFLLVLYIRLQLGWSVAVPVVVMESVGVRRALGRSWHLTKGARGSLFVVWLVLAVMQWLLTMAARHVLGEDLQSLSRDAVLLGVQPTTETGWWASQVFDIAFSSIQAVGAAVAYGALRSSKEGVSHAELLEAFE